MSKDNKISMPMSGGGITRFSGDSASKIEIKPQIVVFLCAFVAILIILLHLQGKALFGI